MLQHRLPIGNPLVQKYVDKALHFPGLNIPLGKVVVKIPKHRQHGEMNHGYILPGKSPVFH